MEQYSFIGCNDNMNFVSPLQSSTSLDAQQQQLQQLQTLQQQLIQQTALMQQPTGGAPLIDANLLAQIQTLTNQLLQKTENKQEDGGFNKVGIYCTRDHLAWR